MYLLKMSIKRTLRYIKHYITSVRASHKLEYLKTHRATYQLPCNYMYIELRHPFV